MQAVGCTSLAGRVFGGTDNVLQDPSSRGELQHQLLLGNVSLQQPGWLAASWTPSLFSGGFIPGPRMNSKSLLISMSFTSHGLILPCSLTLISSHCLFKNVWHWAPVKNKNLLLTVWEEERRRSSCWQHLVGPDLHFQDGALGRRKEHYPHIAEHGNTKLLTCLWHQCWLNVLISRSHHIASIQDLIADSLDHDSMLCLPFCSQCSMLCPPLPCWCCSSTQAD